MADLAFPPRLLVSTVSLLAHTSLEVQEKPSVAEVEMSVITILVHQLEELRVQNLPRKAQGNSAATLPALLRPHCSPTSPSACSSLATLARVTPGCLQSPLLSLLLPTTESSSPPLQDPHPRNSVFPSALRGCQDPPTWIRDLMLAKWVSMAPPCGKF